jgi:hypothetical protein
VEIDQSVIDEWARDWDSPVGKIIDDATQQVEDTARIHAPVSRTCGSRLAPPGFLKSSTRQAAQQHHDADGVIVGRVGAARYPYNFVANPTSRKGYTVNRGGRSTRPGDDTYLDDALNSLAGIIRFVSWP